MENKIKLNGELILYLNSSCNQKHVLKWKLNQKSTYRDQYIIASYLEVLLGELQHVPQNVTDDLGLPLYNYILIVQRLYDFWLHLKEQTTEWDQRAATCGKGSFYSVQLSSFSFNVCGDLLNFRPQ